MTEVSDVSVIICAYTEERWQDLVDAVASVQQQTLPPREIILVIDHNPRLFERAQTAITGVIVIENSEARGLSGAKNSGVAVAQGSLVAFLDDDATAEPDWLELLSQCCADPRVLGAGGTVEPEWLCRQPGWFPEEFYWVVGCSYQRLPEKPVEVRNPFGGCACYRREVFVSAGEFRDGMGRIGTLPMGCEETELCIRARQIWPGSVFLYQPRARIHHHITSTRATWRYFRSRCYAEGLSKAAVTQYVGAKDGLASERIYTLRTLPHGVARNLLQGVLRFNMGGFLRAGAIVAGLLITTAGYARGTMARRSLARKEPPVKAIGTIV
jgi:glucosyl-dolichyl phosphate glucuronosyltransferase